MAATYNRFIGPRSAAWEPIVGTPTDEARAFWESNPTLPTSVELKRAAWRDVRDCDGALVRLLPGIGTEPAHPDTVALVSAVVGYDVRERATGTYGKPNVALLRSSLRRWALRQRSTVAALVSGGAA